MKQQIVPALGRLGILIPGLGAVALPELNPEHDIFKQLMKMHNTLRHIMGEDLITHLGLDYYQEFVEAL